MMGVGVLAHDARGKVVASLCTIVPFITDSAIAGAVAAWKVIEFCCDQGFQRLILERDALEIVVALKQVGPSWTQFGQLIEDSRTRLDSLQFWTTTHTRRENNEAAHFLAKSALHQSLHCVRQGFCPLVFNILQVRSKSLPLDFINI